MSIEPGSIAAVVLAAGMSSRMGQPKMALPWADSTVIGKVVQTLWQGGVDEVVVVTGGAREIVEQALALVSPQPDKRLQWTHNPEYANGEMLTSLQAGLTVLQPSAHHAFMLALGDQPQIQAETVSAVIAAFLTEQARLVVPSYQMRRGHPWLIARSLWSSLADRQLPFTLRDFLQQQQGQIYYVNVNTPSILADLDTPEDYRRHAPV